MTFRTQVRIACVLILLILGSVGYLAYKDKVDSLRAACGRGNILREYVQYDNDQRIVRIQTQINNPQNLTESDIAQLKVELVFRIAKRAELIPIDCTTI